MGGEAQGAEKVCADEGSWLEHCGHWMCQCPHLSTGDLPCWPPLHLFWPPPWPVLATPLSCAGHPLSCAEAARTWLFPPVPRLRLRAEPMCSVRVMQWLLTLLIKTVFSMVHSWAFFFFPPFIHPHLEPGLSPFVVPLALFAELCVSTVSLWWAALAKGKDHGIVGVWSGWTQKVEPLVQIWSHQCPAEVDNDLSYSAVHAFGTNHLRYVWWEDAGSSAPSWCPLQSWPQVLSSACCILIWISASGLSAEFPPCCWDHLPALFLSGLLCLCQCNSFIMSKVLLHVLSWCLFFYPFFEKDFVALPSVSGLYLVLDSSNQKIINLYKIIQYIGN